MTRSAWTLGRGGYGFLATAATLCWNGNDPPAPPPPPSPPPAQPFAVFHTAEQFNERRDREARALIKEQYGMSEAELKKKLARAQELEEAEAQRAKERQTKEEQLEAARAEAEAKRAAAEAAATEARREADVTRICARLGIKNVDYATFEAGKLKEKTTAELEAHFAEQLKDNARKAAYGLDVVAPTPVPAPAPPTGPGPPPVGTPPPPPPAPGGGEPPVVDAMKMTPQEFQTHLNTIAARR